MAEDLAVEVVCPDIELLTKVETNLTCPLDGCNKLLPNSSSLRMHLVKTHNVISNAKENEMFDKGCQNKNNASKKKTLYCCPVDGCVRGRSNRRPFNRLAHVKQHYMTVHGEKKFTCKICSKKFGRNDACLRHEKACGKVFPCSCGCPFNSRTSMLTHAKRNDHAVPHTETTKWAASNTITTSDKRFSNPVNGQSICISVLPIVSKGLAGLRPLRPKKVLANTETQTEQPCFCTDSTPVLVQNNKSVTVDIPLLRPELNASCEYTQTMMDEAYTQTSFITDEQQFDMDFAIDNEEFKELAHSQTQTTWPGLAFGFPLFEDNETQTLEPYLEFDPSNITATDCATQTKQILDDIFSVDTETQTLFPGIQFVEEQFGGNPGIDIETQTLQDIYLDTETLVSDPHSTATFNILQTSSISNVETQTS